MKFKAVICRVEEGGEWNSLPLRISNVYSLIDRLAERPRS